MNSKERQKNQSQIQANLLKKQQQQQQKDSTQFHEFSFSRDPQKEPNLQKPIVKAQQSIHVKKEKQQQYATRNRHYAEQQYKSYRGYRRNLPIAEQWICKMSERQSQSKRIRYHKIQGAKIHMTCQIFLEEKIQQYQNMDSKKKQLKQKQEFVNSQISAFDVPLTLMDDSQSLSLCGQKSDKRTPRYFDFEQDDIDVYQNQKQQNSHLKNKPKFSLTKCFRCGKTGHINKNCLMEKIIKCHYCLKNHAHDQCPTENLYIGSFLEGTIRFSMNQFKRFSNGNLSNKNQQFVKRFPEYDLVKPCETQKSQKIYANQVKPPTKLQSKEKDKTPKICLAQESESDNFFVDGTLPLWNLSNHK